MLESLELFIRWTGLHAAFLLRAAAASARVQLAADGFSAPSCAGHGPVIRRLAAAGGDVSATAADNVSCLHFACQKGSSGAVAELLAAKAGTEQEVHPSPFVSLPVENTYTILTYTL